jgi:hypothetical protein
MREPTELSAGHPDVVALGPAGRSLVLDLLADLDHDDLVLDPKESRILLEAARTVDLAERLAAELAASDLVVTGSTGQPRANPLIDSVDKARRTIAVLLAQVARPDATRAAAANGGRGQTPRLGSVSPITA